MRKSEPDQSGGVDNTSWSTRKMTPQTRGAHGTRVRWCEPDASTSESMEPRNHMLDSVHRRVKCGMQVCACVQVLSRNDVKSGDSSTLVQTVCSVRTFKCNQRMTLHSARRAQYESDTHVMQEYAQHRVGVQHVFVSGPPEKRRGREPEKVGEWWPDERCRWHACRKLSRSH